MEKPTPALQLPNCEVLIPLATVTLNTRVDLGYTVDLLASSAKISPPTPGPVMPAAELKRIAHELGYRVAEGEGISQKAVDRLEFRSFAVYTGATSAPTVIASFIDSGSDGADESQSRHIFVIADRKDGGAYTRPSRTRAAANDNDEYRVYLNHSISRRRDAGDLSKRGRSAAGPPSRAELSERRVGWGLPQPSGWCLERLELTERNSRNRGGSFVGSHGAVPWPRACRPAIRRRRFGTVFARIRSPACAHSASSARPPCWSRSRQHGPLRPR